MIRAIVTDIEGTTSSLSFVKDVLFPYARARMARFVTDNANSPDVARHLAEVSALVGRDLTPAAAADQLIAWIDQDQKATPLKALQGIIWETGYLDGDFYGHIYEDAARKLVEWHSRGMALFVYSSGSVHAQKLLFKHTEGGDLTPLFSGYFDTHTGPKQDRRSYEAIASHIGLPAASILFLSDMDGEIIAAQEAGFATVKLIRDARAGETLRPGEARDFDDILFS
ncbi:MAG: acireductone synthase [Methylococcaceae bacterium]|jgi:enolase-phosphatase E1